MPAVTDSTVAAGFFIDRVKPVNFSLYVLILKQRDELSSLMRLRGLPPGLSVLSTTISNPGSKITAGGRFYTFGILNFTAVGET